MVKQVFKQVLADNSGALPSVSFWLDDRDIIEARKKRARRAIKRAVRRSRGVRYDRRCLHGHE